MRLAQTAGLLIAGEVVGFALPSLARDWMWVAFFTIVVGLVVYGWWGWRIGRVAVFALGIVLALRTDANLRWVLDGNSGLWGPRTPLRIEVEGTVNTWQRVKKGGWSVDFLSHVGPVPLKVIIPFTRLEGIPRQGEVWEVDGWISRHQDKTNRFGRRTLWVPETKRACRVAERDARSTRAQWDAICTELARRVGMGLEWNEELAGLNRAILLGRRNDLSRARKRIFVDAGTIHVFAISGLHVMVVAWMLNAVLVKFGVSAQVRGLVCVPLVWAYVVLTGARPSAVRAALMSTLCLAAPVFGRRPDSLSAWSATVLAVYAWSPERIYDLGCALSFTVMFGIVLWCHWARHFRPWFREGGRLCTLAGGFGVSFAAWVAGVPLAAHAFGRFTPGGLLANLVVIWCAGWMVKFGAGGLAASFVCLPLAVWLNNVAAGFTWTMGYISECVAALPFSSFEVESWSLAGCACWYVGWVAVLLLAGRVLPRRERIARRWWK